MKKFYFAILLLFFYSDALSQESTCYGTTSNGRLEYGVKLPGGGQNFTSYSKTAGLLGRTYVHSKVRDIILSSYKSLEREMPKKVFKYAETGFKEGGKFKPHKTHRNGLSVDFIVPVTNEKSKSVHLPTNCFNKLGVHVQGGIVPMQPAVFIAIFDTTITNNRQTFLEGKYEIIYGLYDNI